MSMFCTQCGKPLEEGQICDCSAKVENVEKIEKPFKKVKFKAENSAEKKERREADIYERGQRIIPDNVMPNKGEISVRQYDIAILRSRSKFTRAEGRLQITNKRLMFRAAGRSLMGRTTLYHEFAIEDIAGLEIRRDYRFSFWDLLLGIFVLLMSLPHPIAYALHLPALSGFIGNEHIYKVEFFIFDIFYGRSNYWLGIVLSVIFLGLSVFLIFKMKRRYLLKILLSSISFICLLRVLTLFDPSSGSLFLALINSLLMLASYVALFASGIGIIIFTVLSSFKPNLAIDIKIKGGASPIQIRRKKSGIEGSKGGASDVEYTGFSEVLPGRDTDRAISTLGAIINDIQKVGDTSV